MMGAFFISQNKGKIMDSEYIEVIGSQPTRPKEIDVTSSAYYVYLRKDIEKYTYEGEGTRPSFTGWKYKERKVPKEQWQMETTAENKQNLDAIMLGLTDLYEMTLV